MPFLWHIPNKLRRRVVYLWSIRSIQFCLFVGSLVAAFLLRFDFVIPVEMRTALWASLYVGVTAKVLTFHAFGLGRGLWRYFTTRDLIRLAATNVAGSALTSCVLLAAGPRVFPRSVLIIDFLLTLLLTSGARAVTRFLLEEASRAPGIAQTRAFIYGAGAAGSLLLSEARSNGRLNRAICGFIDDDPEKLRMLANGIPVLGSGADLRQLAAAHQVSEVLIAIPSATGPQISRIIEYCQQAAVSFRTVPSISELIADRSAVSRVRDVAVEDVLGRKAVKLDQRGISQKLHGKVALVTGAGGSIGSELCRQIAGFGPDKLIALDTSESALFHLERDIRLRMPRLPVHLEIGNIQNRQRLRDILGSHCPSVVYHAAAYKHVPLMEAHAFEAVENNVLGTYQLAMVAAEFGVEDFVMISSDKAVRPTNIMGVTKRVSELLIRALQNGGPRYVSVRFGNVLGSNGSVVPIFQRQIAAGGPVTITHPDMRRYFMTIPEAAQLVLQASSMGAGGEIFILDMGEPVRIVDLARQLILLSGLRPETDIHLVYTGLRPGEKLSEELNLADERTVATRHEKITAFTGPGLSFERMVRHLAALQRACEGRDLRSLVLELKDIVPDYNPSKELLQQILEPGLSRLSAAVNRNAGPSPVSDLVAATRGETPCYPETA